MSSVVQDIAIHVTDVAEYDYGDAPNSYGTLSANQGATHLAVGPRLGATRDVEDDGQPTALANVDDTDFDHAPSIEPREGSQEKEGPQDELFDLAKDPSETNDVHEDYPQVVAKLRKVLSEARDRGHTRPDYR